MVRSMMRNTGQDQKGIGGDRKEEEQGGKEQWKQ